MILIVFLKCFNLISLFAIEKANRIDLNVIVRFGWQMFHILNVFNVLTGAMGRSMIYSFLFFEYPIDQKPSEQSVSKLQTHPYILQQSANERSSNKRTLDRYV